MTPWTIDRAGFLRLLALLVLLAGVCGLTLDAPVASNATAAAKDKGNAKGGHERHDDDGDDDGDDDDDQGNSGKGGEKDNKDKKGKKHKEEAPEPVQVVVLEQAPGYRVTVGCHADEARGESTCVFAGVATTEGETIGGLAVPEGTVCAPVVAGDFARSDGEPDAGWYAVGSGYRGPAFVSNDQPDVLTLVLAGTATTSGTATYWVHTENGVAAAAGPGLRCTPAKAITTDAKSAPTGAIVVQGFACSFSDPAAGAATVDWFAECVEPAASAVFQLTALDGDNPGWQRTETADANGVLRVEGLSPGNYGLVQIDSDWCHAESDRVDDKGNVVVKEGERASVWIFDCTQTATATSTPALK
jgi:hypothetical protein